MAKVIPNYIEMKAKNLAADKSFYQEALGFEFTDYGPDYTCVEAGPTMIGLFAGEGPDAPMPTFQTDDLEAVLESVTTAGAKIEKAIFAFPGGRRFECLDPSGNRIAVYQAD